MYCIISLVQLENITHDHTNYKRINYESFPMFCFYACQDVYQLHNAEGIR